MRASEHDIEQILASEGVIAVRSHPRLRGAIHWRLARGELQRVLPGVYAPAGAAASATCRIAAVPHWDPNAVLTQEAAAQLTFWPELSVPVVRCCVATCRAASPGFAFSRGRIPLELISTRGPLRLTSPALTALDLAPATDGGSIDQALRTRATTLGQLHDALALTSRRHGNRDRRRLLLDSRDEPWSQPERHLHCLLRAAGIAGWAANQPVLLGTRWLFLDVGFKAVRLAIEVDGRRHHTSAEAFESDRERQNLLVLHGWRVVRLTWRMIQDDPGGVVATVQQAIHTQPAS